MTILEYLRDRNFGDKPFNPVLDVISNKYKELVNSNYELVVNDNGEVLVKVPSLKKNNQFEFNKLDDYEYPLIMCMKIDDVYTGKYHQYITKNFLEKYREELNTLFNDVSLIEELKNKVKKLKKSIEYISYSAIGGIILLAVFLIFKNNAGTFVKGVTATSIILLFVLSIYEQFTKDSQVKSLIDGYITAIQTGWYSEDIKKKYVFLCNIME